MISTIIIVFLCLIVIGLFLFFFLPSNKKLDDSFKHSINDITNKIKKEYEEELKKRTELINEEISSLTLQKNNLLHDYNNKVKSCEEKIKQLNSDYEEKRSSIEQSIQNYSQQEQEKMTQQLLDRQKEIKNDLYKVEEKYQLTLTDYECKVFDAKCKYEDEEKELNKKIEEKRQEISNLIEQFKKDEELRKENDFYRITISESDKEDINKLKSMAAQLNNPLILYKLIWETYFKKGFDCMIGRVLGEKAEQSGIYKITNIKNQMCYIGQAVNIKNRWRTHCRRALKCEETTSNKLYQVMWEEGLENFTFQVVEFCDKGKLTEREKFYISTYQAKSYGYNSKI